MRRLRFILRSVPNAAGHHIIVKELLRVRESGILMHITSLPGPYGVGTMGEYAFRFVDFLNKAGQRCWQILPLNPTGYGDSPYQAFSAYAGNPYLIDLSVLVQEGILQQQEADGADWGCCDNKVDYGALYRNKSAVLRKAYGRFQGGAEFDVFCARNEAWLADFALYTALKEQNKGQPWYQWEDGLKFREAEAIRAARTALAEEIRFQSFVQYLFFKQWNRLREYAHDKGVRLIGDVPIYVPYDSADVWKEPSLFQLDEALTPAAVAGCPPDAFSEDGQLWGNPLYDWTKMASDGYGWWLRRLEAAGQLYDIVRIDHFRGLESYWSVPFGEKTARNGRWVKGPGMDFIEAIKTGLPGLCVIAEDLGFLTPEVLKLRDSSGFPGMKVLEFAFDSRELSDYLPHTYRANTVCYTGTHDNMTLRQWLETAGKDTVAYAREYMHLTEQEGLVWGVIRTAMSSVSDLCIIPMQDYLELGGEARMNCPGTFSDANWTWRADEAAMNDALAEKICKLTTLYGRR